MLLVRCEVGKTSAITGASSAPPAATATTAMAAATSMVHGRESIMPIRGICNRPTAIAKVYITGLRPIRSDNAPHSGSAIRPQVCANTDTQYAP